MKSALAWILLIISTLLVGSIVILLNISLVKFETRSEFSGKDFKVSEIWGNVFLYTQDYMDKVKKIEVVYTLKEQNGIRLVDDIKNITVQSTGVEKNGKNLTIYLHYNPGELDRILASPGWLDMDLYVSLCMGREGNLPLL